MEESKPENEVTYSSQDILGSSVAGKNKNFFIRIKQKKQKAQTPASPRKRTTLTKKVKITIIIGIAIIVLGGVSVTTILISNANRMDSNPDNGSVESAAGGIFPYNGESVEELKSELYSMQLGSTEDVAEFDAKVGYLLGLSEESMYDGLVDDLYQTRIDQIEDENLKIPLEINYVDFLVEKGDTGSALNILSGISENEENLDLSLKAKLYAAYIYYYGAADSNEGMIDEYGKKLEEANVKLYPTDDTEVNTEAQEDEKE